MKIPIKSLAIAIGYGFAAGALAALVLYLMQSVQHLLWSHDYGHHPVYIFTVITIGGAILAWIQHYRHQGAAGDGNVQQQLHALHSPLQAQKRDTLLIAVSAIIAVGFGGAVGPEAGLLAVAAGCSAIISLLLAASQQEQRLIRDTGAVAALSGLYGAPPGAAILVDEQANGHTDAQATPLVLKFLAAVCGLSGFWLAHQWLAHGNFQALPLPSYTQTGSDAVTALPTALCGALLGLLYLKLHHKMPQWLAHIGSPSRQILVASIIFAAMAACFPLLRFSGHHEMAQALEQGIQLGFWGLLALALGKVLAMTLCLSGGWRGGEFFPAIFAAAALAAALHFLVPAIPLTVAIVSAAGAMATVCMGKPIAVLLIMLLLTGLAATGALFTGILLSYAAQRWYAKHQQHEAA
jgi:H+/Cl- antiporter ClcA